MIWNKTLKLSYTLSLCVLLGSCGIYSFTGGSVGKAKTFQVNLFQNNAPIVETGLDRSFTKSLQDFIVSQTSLNMTSNNGDLVYDGEIVGYSITPMSATAEQTAAQNRLTIEVKVRFTNTLEEGKDFEKRFSFFYDYPAAAQISAVRDQAFQVIFERLTQDIFTASLANW